FFSVWATTSTPARKQMLATMAHESRRMIGPRIDDFFPTPTINDQATSGNDEKEKRPRTIGKLGKPVACVCRSGYDLAGAQEGSEHFFKGGFDAHHLGSQATLLRWHQPPQFPQDRRLRRRPDAR